MVWEHIQIRENNALGAGDSGDLDIKLPQNRAISRLMLTVRNKNGGTSNTDDDGALETIVNSIEEIKVQAGSRIFKEYSGQACRDWATYRTGRNPFFFDTQVAGAAYPVGWQEASFPIDFGRFPYDRVCGLPAPLYESLDLKVKYDFTVSGTDGFVTGQHKYDLYAELFPPLTPDAMRSLRVIEQRKKQDHYTAATGIEPIDLTIDPTRQLRNVMVSCYKEGTPEGTDVTRVALEVDSAEIMVDDWNRWQWQNAIDCRLKWLQIIDDVHIDDPSHILWSEVPNVEPIMAAITPTAEDVYMTTVGDKIHIVNGATGGTDDIRLAMHSQVIPRCIFLDLDKDLSMREMISQGALDLQVKLTQGGVGAAVEVHEMSIASA